MLKRIFKFLFPDPPKEGLDLKELQKRFDEQMRKETKESLTQWIEQNRKNSFPVIGYEKGSLERAAISYWQKQPYNTDSFSDGGNWVKQAITQYITQLETSSFEGWSEDEEMGYRTACISIKEKLNRL
jgi:hypothetical protein